MKILVVENASAVKNSILKTLSQRGYKLKFATDGNEAWRLINKMKDIRIVIAELDLPCMDGLELCKKIRDAQFPYYIYIMLMTSKIQKSEVIKGIKAGADDILMRPFDPDELQIRVLAGQRIVHLEEDLIEKNPKFPTWSLLPVSFPVRSDQGTYTTFLDSMKQTSDFTTSMFLAMVFQQRFSVCVSISV
jgi:sigma-B regulation protein RsbU (phosphoserine phosphatase)